MRVAISMLDLAEKGPLGSQRKTEGASEGKMPMPAALDPRWVLLSETGEYSIIGRHREPEEADIAAAELALAQAGVSGWIAVMGGSAESKTLPDLVMVRPLREPRSTFEAAVQAFRRHQRSRRAG